MFAATHGDIVREHLRGFVSEEDHSRVRDNAHTV